MDDPSAPNGCGRFKAHYGLSASAYRKRFATGAAHLHGTEADGGRRP